MNISDHTKKLMDSSLIIDSLSHGPMPWSEQLVAMSDKLLETTKNAFKIVPQLFKGWITEITSNEEVYNYYKAEWERSGVNCVSCTVGPLHTKPYSMRGVRNNYALFTHLLEQRQDYLQKVLKAEDIKQAAAQGKRGFILNFQSMQHIGHDLDLVDQFYFQGIRIMQLTYNSRNALGTGCVARKDRGLTHFGKNVVEKMNELGVVVDISHCGMQTSWDALHHSQDPIMATHTLAKDLFTHDRGKTDKFFNGIAENKGFIGILAVPGFLTEKSETKIEDWLDHVDHVVKVAGIDHVGIGSDYYGFSIPPNLAQAIGKLMKILGFKAKHRATFEKKIHGFEKYALFPNFIEGLISRGYSDQEIKKLAGENFYRVFQKIVG